MKILLFGASGLFGLNFIYKFSKIHKITAIIHQNDFNFENVKKQTLYSYQQSEITNHIDKESYDVVINAAALTNIEFCELNKEEAFEVNCNLAKNIALACFTNRVKHVFISTDSLHSGNNKLDNEKSDIEPLNVYAESKANAENEILKNCPSSLILRTTFYGWGMNKRNSLSDWIISSLRNNLEIGCYTNIFFTPLYLFELHQIILSLISANRSGIFNVSSDKRISKYHFAQKIADVFHLNSKLINKEEFYPDVNRVKRPLDLSLSNDKLKKSFNININSLEDQITNLKNDEAEVKNYFKAIS